MPPSAAATGYPQKEQATLFTTIAQWLGVLFFTLGVVVAVIGISMASSWTVIWYAAVTGIVVLFTIVSLAVAIYGGWLSPSWAWIPPTGRQQQRQRDCTRVRFHHKNRDTVSSVYDVIIVGSGISGLTTAAILTQLNYRVCVLEAHEVAGGSTHEYHINGNTKYKFPSGLHYVIPHCEQVLQISCGARYPPVKFPKLGNEHGVYERIRLTLADKEQDDLPIQNETQLRQELHARFPGLKTQLERFERLATSVLTCFPLWSALHVLPWSLRKPSSQLFLPSVWWKYANRSAEQVLSELFADAPESEKGSVNQLTGYLCSLWVDTGCPPHRVSFFMIAAVCLGFPHEGGAYPVGGPAAIGAALAERIQAGGGEVFVRAPVDKILVQDGRAVGVLMSKKYGGGVRLTASKCVVSACGWRNTSRLLADGDGFFDISKLTIPQGEGFVMANVGIKGSAAELGLECCNLWPQPAGPDQSIFDGVRKYLEDPLGVPPTQIPLMITFPTLKDRGHGPNSMSHTAQLLALAKLEWFGRIDTEHGVDDKTPAWKNPGRDEAYQDLKERWKARLQEAFLNYYPKLSGKIEMFDISTPLSIEHYLPTGSGSAIGLDVNAGPDCRFTNLDTMKLLDMKTPIPRLWITGQDTLLCGVPLAQAAGLITGLRIAGPIGSCKIVLKSIWLLLATLGENSVGLQESRLKGE